MHGFPELCHNNKIKKHGVTFVIGKAAVVAGFSFREIRSSFLNLDPLD